MTSTNQSQEQDSRTTFFRQSGWLALATSSGGFFMVATQVVANRWMEPAEYGIWFTLLRIYLLMSIPSVGLQVIFARQAAAAVSDAEQARLAAATRATLAATLVLWVVMAAVALIWQDHWLRVLKIVHPAALWATVVIGLASLWSPVVRGLLQGVQNFLGLGWVLILDGVGRFCAILVILVLGGQSVGGMTGALIGQVVSLGAGFAWLASLLRHRGATMDWRPWLRRVIPLTLGFAGIQLMSTLDVVYVRGLFPKDPVDSGYLPAAMIGLAMVTFTMPVGAVMFPKIVRSRALARESNVGMLALALTAVLGGLAAVVCTLFPELPLRIIYFSKPVFWAASPLVPWFAWGLLPLVLANVLIADLLARDRFVVVPWIIVVTGAYALTLALIKDRLVLMGAPQAFKVVVGTLGGYSLLLMLVAAAFHRGLGMGIGMGPGMPLSAPKAGAAEP